MRPAAFLVPAALLALAGLTGGMLDDVREEAGIVRSAARVPLGGLEPLAIDLLYLRANAFIGERRLPEAVAAIRLVTELQPRIEEGWAFLSTYLAWRNSESAASPEDEWRFVREGLDVLLRGLEHNRGSRHLQFALAHLYYGRMTLMEDIRPVAERELGAPPSFFAMEAFEKLFALDPTSINRAGLADSARLYGQRLVELGRVAEALPVLRESRRHFARLGEDPEAGISRVRVEEIDRLIAEIEDS